VPVTVGEIMEDLDRLAPWGLAEDWDNSGLQVGSRKQTVEAVAVGLNAGEGEFSCSMENGAGLLVTHHPLILEPLKNIDFAETVGSLAARFVRAGMTVVSAHTNLDAAPGGLADRLAAVLKLEEVAPLRPSGEKGLLKLVVFVPEENLNLVIEALKETGSGRIGNYSGCIFHTGGTGMYTPEPGASPAFGETGKPQAVREVRLETRVHRRMAGRAVEAVRRAHPYEEPALDLYPVGDETGAGMGRIGRREISPGELLEELKESLSCQWVRTAGKEPKRITSVAVVPGSGGDLVREARKAGAEAMVTGELKYHQALEAQDTGIWVIEAGHQPTEALAVPLIAGHLEDSSNRQCWDLRVIECRVEGDVFGVV
jgi:dinuclear metal center YbgI/SA1388 family protein